MKTNRITCPDGMSGAKSTRSPQIGGKHRRRSWCATELMSESIGAVADVLESHGDRFSGGSVEDIAQDWLDHNFNASETDGWCEIGVWDASTAGEFRDAELTAAQVKDAADKLVEKNGGDGYTDGCPIYSACNNDTPASEIIDAAKE
jgi:predicted ATPase